MMGHRGMVSARLAEIARETGAILHGEFILRSGRKSLRYIDGITLALNPSAATIIGVELVRRAAELQADIIAGPALGAAPMVSAAVALSGAEGYPLRGALLREDWKGHGKTGLVAGTMLPGEKVLLVDDVTTTGTSLEMSREVIEDVAKATIAGAIVLFDRNGTMDQTEILIRAQDLPEMGAKEEGDGTVDQQGQRTGGPGAE